MIKKLKDQLDRILDRIRGARNSVKNKVAIKEPVALPAIPFRYSGPFSVRRRAISRALIFGLLPWWAYEAEKHHEGGWARHALTNLYLAGRWAFGCETDEDRVFEYKVNA